MSGKSVADSSRFAKYASPKQGSEALSDLRKKLPALMDTLGLSTPDLLRRLHKKLDAQKTITAQWNGEISDIIEVDDHGIQMDAVKLSLRLHGLLTNDSDGGPSHLSITLNNIAVTD